MHLRRRRLKENEKRAQRCAFFGGASAGTTANGKVSSEKLMTACKQFEAYLWEQVYKEMKKSSTTFGDDSSSNDYGMGMVNLFMDNADRERFHRNQ